MTDLAAYAALFASAFGAATLLPLQSEAMLVGLLLADHSPLALLAVASAGNILGSLVNWFIGLRIEHYRDRRWFPVGEPQLAKAQRWYQRYGKWTLLLSWVPVVGDPLTLVAGVMREPLPVFLLLVGVAKVARYAVLAVTVLWAT
ncbi:YqaA family protein [Lysobacter olei]